MDKSRFEEGLGILEQLAGKPGNPFQAYGELGGLAIEHSFCDVYSRGGLTWKQRQLISMTSQIVINALPQFKIHIRLSRNLGVSWTEIEELIIQTSIYAGFPAALNAWKAMQEVREEIEVETS